MPTTIRDVAKAAKVSAATVSLVLNRRPGVGADTRTRVLEIAEKLHYRSLPAAANAPVAARTVRFLRIAKHGHIVNPNHNVFIADYIDGLEREARAEGWKLEVGSYEIFDPGELLRGLDGAAAAGAVVLGTELSESDVAALSGARVPLVFIDTSYPGAGFDFVDMDNESSVRAVVAYLKEQGHRRIGLVKGAVETRNFRLRERSFAEALGSFGLGLRDEDVFAIDSRYEEGCVEMKSLLGSRRDLPTALFCVADVIAYGCLRALKEKGFSVPGDVSLVGFDDLPSSLYTDPGLATVKVSKRRIGERAMQLALRRIASPDAPFEQTLVGGELVARSSVRRIE